MWRKSQPRGVGPGLSTTIERFSKALRVYDDGYFDGVPISFIEALFRVKRCQPIGDLQLLRHMISRCLIEEEPKRHLTSLGEHLIERWRKYLKGSVGIELDELGYLSL